jgi:hypothetical protein
MDLTKHRPNQTLSYQSSEIYQQISLNRTAIIDYLNSHNIDKSILSYWHIEESYWHSATSYWHSEVSYWHSPLLRAKYRLGMMDLKSYWTLHYTVWNQILIMFLYSNQEWYFSGATGVAQSPVSILLITCSVTYAFDASTIYFWLILEFIVHFDGFLQRFRLSLFSMKLSRSSGLDMHGSIFETSIWLLAGSTR